MSEKKAMGEEWYNYDTSIIQRINDKSENWYYYINKGSFVKIKATHLFDDLMGDNIKILVCYCQNGEARFLYNEPNTTNWFSSKSFINPETHVFVPRKSIVNGQLQFIKDVTCILHYMYMYYIGKMLAYIY